ncbi:MAG: TetR/AcrR family transcriptional regulator [bacterium]|nr:TetR/AcrR family transcriptional regulator [bacterium]
MPVFPTSDGSPRQRLMAAALELFSEKGYSSTPVREIVHQAGVTKPVLYYYFKNKEGIFRAVFDWLGEHQKHNLNEILQVQGTTCERLEALIRLFLYMVGKHRKHFEMISSFIFAPSKGVPDYNFAQFPHRTMETVKKIYQEGIERGEVIDIDPGEAALLVMSVLFFSLRFCLLHPNLLDKELPVRLLYQVFRGFEKKAV